MTRTTRVAAPSVNLASLVCGLDGYMLSRGADLRQALRRAKLRTEDVVDPDRRVPLVSYLQLLEICADLLGDPQLGLKFGAQYEPRHAGVVGNIALASPTVGEAFEAVGRYLPTMADATVHRMDVTDGVAFVYSYYIDPLMMSYRQKSDWAIAFACNLMRTGLADPGWTPDEVCLPHLPEESADERRTRSQVMGSNVRAGQPWAGIRFDATLLKRPMATADLMLGRLMRHYGDLRLATLPERADDIDQLRREIARMLVKGEASIERCAMASGTSVRTLQRRLHDLGLSYSRLQDDVRRTMALNLLENDTLALAEIAFSIGYSDVSAFNHAFRRWVGRSPGDHRQGQRAATTSSGSREKRAAADSPAERRRHSAGAGTS